MTRVRGVTTSPKMLQNIKTTLNALVWLRGSFLRTHRPRVRLRHAAFDLMNADNAFTNRATSTNWATLVAASKRSLRAVRADQAAQRAKADQQDAVAGTSGGAFVVEKARL